HGDLSDLVCAEHAGARGYFRSDLFALGAGICAPGPGPKAGDSSPVVYCGCVVQGDGDCDPADAGSDGGGSWFPRTAAGSISCVARGGMDREQCDSAGGVVRLASREDGILFGEPRVLAI